VRLTRCHLYLLVALMVAIVGPAVFSQPNPGMGFGKGKGGAGGFDFFAMIAQGKDSFNVNDVQLNPRMEAMRERWVNFLQTKGITDGIMNKALFDEMSQSAMQQRMAGGGGMGGGFGGGFGGGAPGGFGGPGGGKGRTRTFQPGGQDGASQADPKEEDAKIDEEARLAFARMDQNKDGYLDREEAGRWIRDFDRYDLNKDGKLSIEEYTESYRDTAARQGRGSRAIGGANIVPGEEAPPEEDKRPIVYRFGKLPKELPKWFTDLDTDKDGQVGLYEWKAGGRTTVEFLSYDANADGFLTVEEVMRVERAKQPKNKQGGIGVANAGGANGAPGGGRFGAQGWAGAAGMPAGGMQGRGGRPAGGGGAPRMGGGGGRQGGGAGGGRQGGGSRRGGRQGGGGGGLPGGLPGE
jgi:Ca2+-binding EF-hand superfamily protein